MKLMISLLSLLRVIAVSKARSCLEHCTSNTDIAVCRSRCMHEHWPELRFADDRHDYMQEYSVPGARFREEASSFKVMNSDEYPIKGQIADIEDEYVETEDISGGNDKERQGSMFAVDFDDEQQQSGPKKIKISYSDSLYGNESSRKGPAAEDQLFPTSSFDPDRMEVSPETVTVRGKRCRFIEEKDTDISLILVFATHTSHVIVMPGGRPSSSSGVSSNKDHRSAADVAHPFLTTVVILALSVVSAGLIA